MARAGLMKALSLSARRGAPRWRWKPSSARVIGEGGAASDAMANRCCSHENVDALVDFFAGELLGSHGTRTKTSAARSNQVSWLPSRRQPGSPPGGDRVEHAQ